LTDDPPVIEVLQPPTNTAAKTTAIDAMKRKPVFMNLPLKSLPYPVLPGAGANAILRASMSPLDGNGQ
jgi:hypothetical protein